MPEITTSSTYPLVFLRCRTIAFCAIVFFSFIWVILLCIVLYLQWELMDRPYQSILMVMLAVDTITAVLLLVLLNRKFRAWLDAARILFLLAAHLGVAAAFAHWSPGFSCPQPSRDDQAVCKMLILYILISSWALPALIAIYSGGLGVMAIHRWRHFRAKAIVIDDLERDSFEKKRDLHMSQQSSFIQVPLSTGSSPMPTPIASRFSTTQAVPPNQFTLMQSPPNRFSNTQSTPPYRSSTNLTTPPTQRSAPQSLRIPPNQFSMEAQTPTSVDFSSYYLPSPIRASPAATPSSSSFFNTPNPYNYVVPSPSTAY
ncbi:hypothetical protein DFP72DRAFT_1162965 [Ephemerocybe angulata]|uniref:Uncharacterized protein n=1 Tax=Ephemerocybe angulata TaxID=980116 RepID=A0A8H6MGN8_9AGAR|nr:hypothetical protein DFP72DRAFT_1162965 [Tulosesus angulatus]